MKLLTLLKRLKCPSAAQTTSVNLVSTTTIVMFQVGAVQSTSAFQGSFARMDRRRSTMYATINSSVFHDAATKIPISALHLWTACKNARAIRIAQLGAALSTIALQRTHARLAEKSRTIIVTRTLNAKACCVKTANAPRKTNPIRKQLTLQ